MVKNSFNLTWCPPPIRDESHFNFEKLKSLGEEFFFLSYGESKSIWRMVIVITKGGWRGGDNSVQNNYTLAHFFFQGKVTFMVTIKEKIVFIFTSLVLKGYM